MKTYIFICLFSFPLLCFSQEYRAALGAKLGYPGLASLNAKIFAGKKIALDNSLSVNFDNDNRFLAFQTLVEYNKGFGLNPGYNWYAGLGPQVNYYLKGGYLQNDGTVLKDRFYVKCDGVFGAEFSAPKTNFNAAIEAGPSLMVLPEVNFGFFINVAARYTIKVRF